MYHRPQATLVLCLTTLNRLVPSFSGRNPARRTSGRRSTPPSRPTANDKGRTCRRRRTVPNRRRPRRDHRPPSTPTPFCIRSSWPNRRPPNSRRTSTRGSADPLGDDEENSKVHSVLPVIGDSGNFVVEVIRFGALRI